MSIKPKHIISGILLLLVVFGVIFLTLQGPEDTVRLSESFRKVALQIGYTGDARQFRSDVHIIEYFIVGLFAVIFVKSIGIKIWIGIVSTCIIGILDETVKILLPTREFSFIDLIKDFAGAGEEERKLLLLMCKNAPAMMAGNGWRTQRCEKNSLWNPAHCSGSHNPTPDITGLSWDCETQ